MNELERATSLAQVFQAEWSACQRRFMHEPREWDELTTTEQASVQAGIRGVLGAIEDARVAACDQRAADEPKPAARYALVEQMGHRAMVGTVQEVTFCGKAMLEVRRIDVVPSVTVRVSPDSFYDVTDLTADQAAAMARTYGRSTGGLDAAGVVTRYISEHRQQLTAASAEDEADDFAADRHADLDAGENGGAMTDADFYDRTVGGERLDDGIDNTIPDTEGGAW